jgi:hypothetical protein
MPATGQGSGRRETDGFDSGAIPFLHGGFLTVKSPPLNYEL